LRARAPLVLVLAAALAASAAACSRVDAEPLPSVRLGMAPRDVRERFEPGGPGSWQTRVGAGDDTVLEWTSREPASRVEHARFEFHLGMLVAVRARLREGGGAERVEVTPKTVTMRRPVSPKESDVTVLARDCPTHKDEADSLASRAK
jgi:hypothetical protein